jgi:hypothetical protein
MRIIKCDTPAHKGEGETLCERRSFKAREREERDGIPNLYSGGGVVPIHLSLTAS